VVVGVDAPSEVVVDSARDLFDGAFCTLSPSPVVEVFVLVVLVVLVILASGGSSGPVLLLLPATGASVFGFDFLRGFMRAGSEKEVSRRNGRFVDCQPVQVM